MNLVDPTVSFGCDCWVCHSFDIWDYKKFPDGKVGDLTHCDTQGLKT